MFAVLYLVVCTPFSNFETIWVYFPDPCIAALNAAVEQHFRFINNLVHVMIFVRLLLKSKLMLNALFAVFSLQEATTETSCPIAMRLRPLKGYNHSSL